MLSFSVTFAAILATLFFSASTVFSKFLIADINNPFRLLRVQLSMNLGFMFILMILANVLGMNILDNLDIESLLIISLSGCFVFIGFVLFYMGLMEGNTSAAAVITSSRVILSVIIGFLFFMEQFPIVYYFWIILILIGVFLVSWSPEVNFQDIVLFKTNGAGFFVVSVASWAIANSFIRILNNSIFLFTLIVIKLVVIVSLSFFTYPLFNKYYKQHYPDYRERNFPSTTFWKISIYLVFFIIADLLITYAVGESLTITESISTLQGVIVFIIVILLSLNGKLRDILDEELSKRTVVIRGLGILIAFLGGLNLILF